MTEPGMAPGSLIAGRYRLERHLGEGGMGTVWSAVHVITRRSVALKFLRTEIQHKVDVRQRFLREAQAVSALRHPNVVEVIDVFDLPDRSPVIVMDLLEGETLAEKLVRDERLSTEETASVMLPVVAAVASAHAMGIVHRDLKPENIFLVRGKAGTVVKVLDFGIAKVTRELYEHQSAPGLVTESGSLLGTPCYMAPEQVTNTNVDHRADVWSLGVILYECLSGTRPIEGQNTTEVIARLLSEAITPLERLAPELPHEVTGLVRQMLSRDPKRRLQDLGELTKVLERYTHGRSVTFDGPSRLPSAKMVEMANEATLASAEAPPASASKPVPTRRTTMRSAPAVGIDDALAAAEGLGGDPRVFASRSRLMVGTVVLVLFGLLLVIASSLRSRSVPPSPSAPPPTAALAIEKTTEMPPSRPGEATPKIPETQPPPALRSSDAPTPPALRHARVTSTPQQGVRVAPSKQPSAQPNEDTLFSGRK